VPRIMLVEDDEAISEALSDLLREEGYEVTEVNSPTLALELLKFAPPDAIMSDVLMPGIDGVDFYQVLQSDPALRTLPFVIMTASPKRADLPSVPIVEKPFDLAALVKLLRELTALG
jgi:CheY-like chemotaxis protein